MPTFNDVYLGRIKELRESHKNHITGGSAKTMEEYKNICGFLRGLDVAESEFKELVSRVEEG
jgi:hypothetical protein